jgi:hypothetical protein
MPGWQVFQKLYFNKQVNKNKRLLIIFITSIFDEVNNVWIT